MVRDARPDPEDEDADGDFEDAPDPGDARPGGDAAAPVAAVPRVLRVDAALTGVRLDRALASLLPEHSRSQLRRWIDEGRVRVQGRVIGASAPVSASDRIELVEPVIEVQASPRAEAMDLCIVHEDAHILVLDKPPGLVVHPGAGNPDGTLMNGLLAHDPALGALARAGIVHRLDSGTSGLMVVARTALAQTDLSRQLLARSVTREYWAIALAGSPASLAVGESGVVDAAIERDPRNRLRFRVGRSALARPARTHWRCLARLEQQKPALCWISCRLETGRTHQIRVHLEHLGHPLLGDPVYRRGVPAGWDAVSELRRQALHACRLELTHPQTGERLSWFRAPPPDLRSAMLALGIDERRIDRPTPAGAGAK